MRVSQKACVEYQIGVPRQAHGKRERDQRQHHARAGASGRRAEIALDELAHGRDGKLGRVDHQIGMFAQQAGQHLLLPDPVGHTALRRKRMPPARLGVAAQQCDLIGPDIDQRDSKPRHRAQRRYRLQHAGGIEAPCARVHPNGQWPVAAGHHLGQHR